jgi:hypothetical protein
MKQIVDGYPEGIVWMTPKIERTSSVMVRFSSLIARNNSITAAGRSS